MQKLPTYHKVHKTLYEIHIKLRSTDTGTDTRQDNSKKVEARTQQGLVSKIGSHTMLIDPVQVKYYCTLWCCLSYECCVQKQSKLVL